MAHNPCRKVRRSEAVPGALRKANGHHWKTDERLGHDRTERRCSRSRFEAAHGFGHRVRQNAATQISVCAFIGVDAVGETSRKARRWRKKPISIHHRVNDCYRLVTTVGGESCRLEKLHPGLPMLSPRLLPSFCLMFMSVLCIAQETPKSSGRSETCPVTKPATQPFVPPAPYDAKPGPGSFWFGTDSLWTALPKDGLWIGGHYTASDPTNQTEAAVTHSRLHSKPGRIHDHFD